MSCVKRWSMPTNILGPIEGDIEPRNLIVDLAGTLKLKDFGIANCITDGMRRLTAIHDTSETLQYKSPQRPAGEEPAITDDLYSLGATIYELLTSRPPFYAGHIGDQVSGKTPPSMTERRAELGIEGEAIPKNWEETVAACLAKDPVRRPQSAIEVEARLKNSASPSDIRSTSIAKPKLPVRNPAILKPWLVIVSIMFMLALVSVLALFSFHPLTEPQLEKIAFEHDSCQSKYFPRRSLSRYNSPG